MVQLGGNSVFAGMQLKFPLHYSDWITLTVPFFRLPLMLTVFPQTDRAGLVYQGSPMSYFKQNTR